MSSLNHGIEVPEGTVSGKRRKKVEESKGRERKPWAMWGFWVYDRGVKCGGIHWPQDLWDKVALGVPQAPKKIN